MPVAASSVTPAAVMGTVLQKVLPSPAHHLVPRSVVLVRYRGRVSGRTVTLPVQVASYGRELLVLVAHPDRKRWWRNFRGGEQPVEVCLDGRWRTGAAESWSTREQPELLGRYVAKHPRADKHLANGSDAPLVVVRVQLDFVKLEHTDGTAVTEPGTTYGWQDAGTN